MPNLVAMESRESKVCGVRISGEWWQENMPKIHTQLDTVKHIWEDYYTKEDISGMVLGGQWQAWGFGEDPDINIIVLTQVLHFPANRVLQVIMAFGNSLDKCLPMIESTLERFSRLAGCQLCEIAQGRVGWERKLKRFKRCGIVLRCRVPEHGVH